MSYGKHSEVPRKALDLLNDMISDSLAKTAMLVTKEGFGVAEAGDTSYLNTTALAALIAGMFSATREVARMVGEKHFSILLQQGEQRHIHISLINDSMMMVVVFEDYQRIGRIRFEAKKIGEALHDLYNEAKKVKNAMRMKIPSTSSRNTP